MSSRNGDKARFARQRKAKLLRRARTKEILKTLESAAAKAKPKAKARRPKSAAPPA